MLKEKFDARRGQFTTYRASIIATDSRQREAMMEAFRNCYVQINLNGNDTAIIMALDGRGVETSAIERSILSGTMLKFWTKSGTYYCFYLMF